MNNGKSLKRWYKVESQFLTVKSIRYLYLIQDLRIGRSTITGLKVQDMRNNGGWSFDGRLTERADLALRRRFNNGVGDARGNFWPDSIARSRVRWQPVREFRLRGFDCSITRWYSHTHLGAFLFSSPAAASTFRVFRVFRRKMRNFHGQAGQSFSRIRSRLFTPFRR